MQLDWLYFKYGFSTCMLIYLAVQELKITVSRKKSGTMPGLDLIFLLFWFESVNEKKMTLYPAKTRISLARWVRVPTSTGKPGKSQKKVPCMEKSWNLKKNLKNHGKIMEFCEIICVFDCLFSGYWWCKFLLLFQNACLVHNRACTCCAWYFIVIYSLKCMQFRHFRSIRLFVYKLLPKDIHMFLNGM